MSELEIGGRLKNITGDGMVTSADRVVCEDGRTVEERLGRTTMSVTEADAEGYSELVVGGGFTG